MEQQLEQIEQLLFIFDEREKLTAACNREIAVALTPTVLSALFDLFNLPTESVVWEDFQIIESVLVLRATLTYDSAHELSPFLNLIVPPRDGVVPIRIQKTIQFGVPLTKVFDDKDALKEWFMEVVAKSTDQQPDSQSKEQLSAHPDLNLTKDQVAQMLYFQKLHGSDPQ